jgi:hypothetical protein
MQSARTRGRLDGQRDRVPRPEAGHDTSSAHALAGHVALANLLRPFATAGTRTGQDRAAASPWRGIEIASRWQGNLRRAGREMAELHRREAELQADARVNAPEPARGTPSITPAADADCASQHSRQGAILVDWVGRVVEAASGARLDVYSHKHTFGALPARRRLRSWAKVRRTRPDTPYIDVKLCLLVRRSICLRSSRVFCPRSFSAGEASGLIGHLFAVRKMA